MQYEEFVDLINQIGKRHFIYLDRKARRQLEYLNKSGLQYKDYEKAIRNAYTDNYHRDTNFKYLTPEFLSRADKFDKFFNVKNEATTPLDSKEEIDAKHDALIESIRLKKADKHI